MAGLFLVFLMEIKKLSLLGSFPKICAFWAFERQPSQPCFLRPFLHPGDIRKFYFPLFLLLLFQISRMSTKSDNVHSLYSWCSGMRRSRQIASIWGCHRRQTHLKVAVFLRQGFGSLLNWSFLCIWSKRSRNKRPSNWYFHLQHIVKRTPSVLFNCSYQGDCWCSYGLACSTITFIFRCVGFVPLLEPWVAVLPSRVRHLPDNVLMLLRISVARALPLSRPISSSLQDYNSRIVLLSLDFS